MSATAPSEPAKSPAERRIAPRLQPAFGTVCRLGRKVGDDHDTIGLVWNISETGVSMLLADPPERGTELAGELAAETGGEGFPVNVRVVHIRQVPTGDYFIGAQFTRPLAADELSRFVTPPPPPLKPAEIPVA
jgi:hypothetical protein